MHSEEEEHGMSSVLYYCPHFILYLGPRSYFLYDEVCFTQSVYIEGSVCAPCLLAEHEEVRMRRSCGYFLLCQY